jgi:EAL domain-containing protein (putative c-di-GMP-specific phosphodiesterase class I)
MSEHSALSTLLRPGGITPLFQPIIRLQETTTSLHALECLSRGPAGTNFENAGVLFDYVRLKREESLVDRACISAAFAQSALLPPDTKLCVNVHASTLGRDLGFVPFLQSIAARHAIAMSRITVEVVEHAPPWDSRSFLAAIEQLRQLGTQLAVDDVGLGQSNFKMLIDVGPDYLKLDRYFVAGCAGDRKRRAVVAAVTQLARDFDAEVVAEGIEDPADVEVLQSHGISLMQGFLYAKPMPADQVSRVFRAA